MPTEARRIHRVLSAEEQARLTDLQQKIAAERDDLIEKNRMRFEANQEQTLSGQIRRAIHAGPISLTKLAESVGLPLLHLDEFLTGERTLRSDVLDRLGRELGFVLQRAS